MANRFCTQCGAELREGSKFCPSCGAAVPDGEANRRSRETKAKGGGRSRRRRTPPQRRALSASEPVWKNPLLWIGAGLALVLGLALLYLLNPGLSETNPAQVADGGSGSGIPSLEVPRVSLADAKARFDAGTALFVDVRSQVEYVASHIPDAVMLPVGDLDVQMGSLPRNAEIITYCT
jgi:hypothetical protein